MNRILISIFVIVMAVVAFYSRIALKSYWQQIQKPDLPMAQLYDDVASISDTLVSESDEDELIDTNEEIEEDSMIEKDENVEEEIKLEVYSSGAINLSVPFQSQAPFGNWQLPYQEACEEAAVIMVEHYLSNDSLTATFMNEHILDLVSWEQEHGYKVDVSINELQIIVEEYYGRQTLVIDPVTENALTEQLNMGRAVIVPVAGRELNNPNFTPPGPIYHMLVIKGYTDDGFFITNDPGTRNGADYLYESEVLMAAIRDWDGDSPDGDKVGLVFYR